MGTVIWSRCPRPRGRWHSRDKEKLISSATESSKLQEGWEDLPKWQPGQPGGTGAVGRDWGTGSTWGGGTGGTAGRLGHGEIPPETFPEILKPFLKS